ILEAWSMQKCVVSTKLGAEGLEYQDGTHLAIANDAPAMAATVVRALRDADYRQSMQSAGRAAVPDLHPPQPIAPDHSPPMHSAGPPAVRAAPQPDRMARHYSRHIAGAAEARSGAPGPMRLAIDLRWLVPGRAGGIENMARSFVRHLLAIDRHNRYTIMLPAQ